MSLSDKELRLARLTAAIVLGRWDVVTELRKDAPTGEPDRAWRETVLMMHLFAGIPRQIDAYEALTRAGGLGTLEPDEDRDEDDVAARGGELFDLIYAAQSRSVRDRIGSFHPDFARFVFEHAYGRVLSRPGLSPAQRELFAVAALTALGQGRQLASHARGACRAGASPQDVEDVVHAVADLLDGDRVDNARGIIHRFVSR